MSAEDWAKKLPGALLFQHDQRTRHILPERSGVALRRGIEGLIFALFVSIPVRPQSSALSPQPYILKLDLSRLQYY